MLVSKAALDAGRSVAIYSVPRLLAEIKGTYDRDSDDSYMRLFRRLCAVDLLHLDDLGAERRTEWVLEQLYSIVNERWQNERSIVVTTNLLEDRKSTRLNSSHANISYAVFCLQIKTMPSPSCQSRKSNVCGLQPVH